MKNNQEVTTPEVTNFIQEFINADQKKNSYKGEVHTRFPPEPNGYLHIGHAKSICLNFGTALKNQGLCNLRFDDTNPSKEEQEYVESIKEDVKWLGFDWGGRLYFASDYYEKLYEFAVRLIEQGKAYVCDLSPDEIRAYRGTLTEPGQESPYRQRGVAENLALFKRMRAGEFADGSRVLRAKINMAAPNLNLRDPVLYRILRAKHHRTGAEWVIYPMYDFAHPLSDYLEGITHSLCTLEFEDHRPLYNWILAELALPNPPRQIEFARLNLNYTVMSKRKLLELVKSGFVKGWDDPRLPTISGLRRRGYTPEAIRDFCERIGVSKSNSQVDYALLEHCLREHLNLRAARVMAVLRPLKVIIDNYPADQVEEFDAEINPEKPELGTRKVPFGREIFIEADDFMEEPPKGYFRLAPGREIRLKHAYYIKCEKIVKDADGKVLKLHCTYDRASRGGWTDDGRKVKGTCQWVSAAHALRVEVRLYERLFATENPEETEEAGADYREKLNPNSLQTLDNCLVEPSLANSGVGEKFQFLRQGYFVVDPETTPEKLVFNRIVSLKDSWKGGKKS